MAVSVKERTKKKVNIKDSVTNHASDKFREIANEHLREENEQLELLRTKSRRIVALVKPKFNLVSYNASKTHGLRVGKIHSIKTKALWLQASNQNLAISIRDFLTAEGYDVVMSDRDLSVNLIKEINDVKLEQHEKTSELQKSTKLSEELKEALALARTQHLTPDQIGSRIWDYMVANNVMVIDGNKKITIMDIFNGIKLSDDWDRDTFVNLVVVEALK